MTARRVVRRRRPVAEPGSGTVFVVSAPSGAGKTTLCRRLLAEVPGIGFSVSCTTRARRADEREGVDYHFIDRAGFDRRRKAGEFIEWARVGGDFYGTAAGVIAEATSAGLDILLDLDTQGAASVRRLLPGAVLIFILPPDREALRARLSGRGSESPETLDRRLGLAGAEIDKTPLYDYVVVNDDLEVAYRHLAAIVLASRCRYERQAVRVRAIAQSFGARSVSE